MIHPDDLRQLLAAYYPDPEPEPEPVFRPKSWDEMFAGKAMSNIGEARLAPQTAPPIAPVYRSGKWLPNPFTGLKLRPYREPEYGWRHPSGPPGTEIMYPFPGLQNPPRTEVSYQWDSQPNIDIQLMSADGEDNGNENKGEAIKPAPTPEPAAPPPFRRKSMDEILEGKGTPRGGAASLDPIPEPGSVAAINAEADAKAAAAGQVGSGTGFLSDPGTGRERRIATGAQASSQVPIWNRSPVTPPFSPGRFPLSSGTGPIGGGTVTAAEQARQLGKYLSQSNPGGAFREANLAGDWANMTHTPFTPPPAYQALSQEVQAWQDALNPQIHYRRNQELRNPTDLRNRQDLRERGFSPVENRWESILHQLGKGNENNEKWLANDGRWEATVREDGQIDYTPENMGSANKTPASESWYGHFRDDMAPYWLYGNAPDDSTTVGQRTLALLEGAGLMLGEEGLDAMTRLGEELDRGTYGSPVTDPGYRWRFPRP